MTLIICFSLYSCNRTDKEKTIIRKKIVFVRDIPEKVIEKKVTGNTENLFIKFGLIDVNTLDSTICIQLKYSDTANFLHFPLYDDLEKAYFPCEVALKVCNAQYYLKKINPQLSLVIFDASRPWFAQKLMWDSLKMEVSVKFKFVAPPYLKSLHNYGCAVDISIINTENNQLLDMGSSFDSFEKISEPYREQYYLNNKKLDSTQIANRNLLRNVMKSAGFTSISSEWWHFNSCSKAFAETHFQLIP
ncbi:MAG: M15 family metallopeptidase [Sphingobacteriaceae bacterium]|nr:M15 family metallopeptidase [Sphingobacteriaceae bacterium]